MHIMTRQAKAWAQHDFKRRTLGLMTSLAHLFKHTDDMASVVLDAAVGDHLKTAVNDRPIDQVISN